MKVLSAAERRLIAALDRLDHAVEQAGRRMAETPAARHDVPAPPAAPPDGGISPEIAALHDRQAATLEAMQTRLAEADERLATAGEQAARLAAANEELAQANRALIEAAGGGPDVWADSGEVATFAALQAEVEALRAARAAEIAQMGEILDALDRMLGVAPAPRSHSTDDLQRVVAAQAGEVDADSQKAKPETGPAGDDDAIRELSVIRDEDPLPEDEPAPDADMPEEIRFGQGRDEDIEEERG